MKVSIVYVYLYGMMKREAGMDNNIHIGKIHILLKWTIRIPKKYHMKIINEMEELGILKKICRDNYKIQKLRIKPLLDSLGEPLW